MLCSTETRCFWPVLFFYYRDLLRCKTFWIIYGVLQYSLLIVGPRFSNIFENNWYEKIQKKLKNHFWEKCWTDWLKEWRLDKQMVISWDALFMRIQYTKETGPHLSSEYIPDRLYSLSH